MSVEEIPFGNEFEGAIKSFNKKAAGTLAPVFVRALTNATEIYFRRDLGERFFTGAFSGGILLWSVAGLATAFTGGFAGGRIPGVVSCVLLIIAFLFFANENTKTLKRFRAEGKTYHSMSRGVPRWDKDPYAGVYLAVAVIVILLLLAPAAGVLFCISRYLSAQESAKQQAAMYDRYLDAIDAKIEGELLQDALLGKCPPEVTYLYKPLPTDLKPELRENIAAAAVGKPVRIVAQAPRPATSV